MHGWQLLLFGVTNFFVAILSGAAGGGGGVVNTPLAIFLGLTPQQAISTGKLTGLAISLGSLQQLRKAKLHNWQIIIPSMILASIIGVLAPILITSINNEAYSKLLGVLLLAMIPVILVKKVGRVKQKVSALRHKIGYLLLVPTLLMQAVFSTGMGMLVSIVFMSFMGMSALEAAVTKRFVQLVLNTLIFIGVIISGLVVWHVAIVAVLASLVGSWVGGRLALKKGDKFVSWIFIILMFISGIGLLIS